MNKSYSVLVVDEQPLVRAGLRAALAGSAFEVVAEARSAPEASQWLATRNFDIVIVDVALSRGDGLTVIRDVRARAPDTRTLVLSACDEAIYAERVLRAGAQGYVSKHRELAAVVQALHQIVAGEVALSETVKTRLLTRWTSAGDGTPKHALDRLSDREVQVLTLIGDGFSTRQIAEKLGLSVKTVDSHREHLKSKLDMRSGPDLVRYAITWRKAEGVAA